MKLLKIHAIVLILFLNSSLSIAEENIKNKNTEFNIFTGMFDFSDHGKRSTLIGFQHQNEDLYRDTFLGNLSPITGAMITADNATYFYTGVQAQYKLGALNFTPSFAPGYYNKGDGKDFRVALVYNLMTNDLKKVAEIENKNYLLSIIRNKINPYIFRYF